jgi:GNAT superfamily N-acetyltransferase
MIAMSGELIKKLFGINEKELQEMEDKRAKHLGEFFIETKTKHPIHFELRFKHGMVQLGEKFIGNEGVLEIDVEDDTDEPFIMLQFIQISPEHRRKGFGSKYMKNLTDLADKYGYDMELDVAPKFGVSENVLIEFYEQHGFGWQFNDGMMARKCKKLNEGGE